VAGKERLGQLQIGGDDAPAAGHQWRVGQQRRRRQQFRRRGRADGRVVLPVDQRRAQGRVAHHQPPGAQPRQPVGLRQPGQDDGPFVAVGGRGQPVARVALQPAIHLIAQQPRAAPPDDGDERREHVRRGQVAGRVVGEVDDDQPRVGLDQPLQFGRVERPAAGHRPHRPMADVAADVLGQVEQRVIGRGQGHDVVARLQQGAQGQVDALFRRAEQHDGLGRHVFVERGHGRPQRGVALGLGVAEALAQQVGGVQAGQPQQFARGQRLAI